MSRQDVGCWTVALAALAATRRVPRRPGASFTQEPGSPYDRGRRTRTASSTADFTGDGRARRRGGQRQRTASSVSLLRRQPAGGFTAERAGAPMRATARTSPRSRTSTATALPDVAVSNFWVDERQHPAAAQPGGGVRARPRLADRASATSASAIATARLRRRRRRSTSAVANWDGARSSILRRNGETCYAEAPRCRDAASTRAFIAVGRLQRRRRPRPRRSRTTTTARVHDPARDSRRRRSLPTAARRSRSAPARRRRRAATSTATAARTWPSRTTAADSVTLLLRPAAAASCGAGSPMTPSATARSASRRATSTATAAATSRSRSNTAEQRDRAAARRGRRLRARPELAGADRRNGGAYGVAVADFDADTRQDLAVTNDAGGSVTILLNTTPFPPPPPPPPPPNLDGDGDGVQRPTRLRRRQSDDPARRARHARRRDRPGLQRRRRPVPAARPARSRRSSARSRSVATRSSPRWRSSRCAPATPCGSPVAAAAASAAQQDGRSVRKDRKQVSLLRHIKRARLRRGAVVQLRVTRPGTIGAGREMEDPRAEEPDHLAQVPAARRHAADALPELIRAAPRARPAR